MKSECFFSTIAKNLVWDQILVCKILAPDREHQMPLSLHGGTLQTILLLCCCNPTTEILLSHCDSNPKIEEHWSVGPT